MIVALSANAALQTRAWPEMAMGQKRKWRRFQVVSALPHKADIDARDCDVCFVPDSDSTLQQATTLFDHLVGKGIPTPWPCRRFIRSSLMPTRRLR
jgi:hypothetical protein